MTEVNRAAIEAAAGRIAGHVRKTPVLELDGASFGLGFPVTAKLELTQFSGSFKARGAFNNLLSRTPPPAGVVTLSGGNHGLATAVAAARLGVPARIFVPDYAAPAKIAGIRKAGIQPALIGGGIANVFAAAEAYRAESGAMFIHPYDAPETLAGQGTLARELEEQAPDLDTLLVAVGGGGLIGGVAAWYDGRTRIIAVETEGTACYAAALRDGPSAEIKVAGVAADSLGASRIGAHGLAILTGQNVASVIVSDDAVVDAQRRLWSEARIAAEPAGAVSLAALTSGAYVPAEGERVGVVVCGGNVDLATLA
jgi:threonine dehydratase